MRRAVQRNAAASYLFFATSAVVTFVTSPMLIAALGASSFGAFKSIQKLMDIVSVADGRAGQALKWTVARHMARGDENELSAAVSNAARTAGVFAGPLVAIICCLTFTAPYFISAPDDGTRRLITGCVAILGLNLVMSPLLAIPDAALVGSNRGYVSILIQMFWVVATNIALVALAAMGFTIVILAVAVLVGTLANAACVFVVTRATTPWFRWSKPNRAHLRSFIGLSGWLLICAGVEKVLLFGEVVLISSLLGAHDVFRYVVATYIVQLVLATLQMTVSAATPSIGRMLATDRAAAASQVRIAQELVLALAIVGATAILLLNRSFVGHWIGPEAFIGETANLIIALLLVQTAVIRCDSQMGDLTLDVRGRALVGLVSTALTILLPLFVLAMGHSSVTSILAVLVVARLPLLVFSAHQVRTRIGASRARVRAIPASIVMVGLGYWGGTTFAAHSWIELIIAALGAGIVLAGSAFFLILSSDTRQAIITVGREILRRAQR